MDRFRRLYQHANMMAVTMAIATFLHALFAEGRVRVPFQANLGPEDMRAADLVLVETERQYRQELPGTPPGLAIESARWAAVMFFRACQFVAFRDLGEEEMDRAFQPECPGGNAPETHYSVDLTFRYLPDLLRLARSPAEGDPLMKRLRHWADRWPLSSVGVSRTQPGPVEAVVRHPSLLCLYGDRVITSNDVSRLVDSRVRQRVAESLGAFPELAPAIAAAMKPPCSPVDEKDGVS